MILESITLENVGPFRGQKVIIGPLAKGLNILAEYNEEGKSTLIWAATRALFDKHTGKSDEIKALQPVGTDLSPIISVVFTSKDKTYKIQKRFINSPSSQLYERIQDEWHILSEGAKSDKRVFDLLGSVQPGRGATKPEHWGLLRYLWARQGEPAYWPKWESESGEYVRSRLAKIEIDTTINQISESLEKEYEPIFTPTGRIKQGGALDIFDKEIDVLQVNYDQIKQHRQTIEKDQIKFNILTVEFDRLKQEKEKADAKKKHLAEQKNNMNVVAMKVENLKNMLIAAEKRLNDVNVDWKRIEECHSKRGEYQNKLTQTSQDISIITDKAQRMEQDMSIAETDALNLQQKQKDANNRYREIHTIKESKRLSEEIGKLETLLEKIKDSSAELDITQRKKASCPQISKALLDEMKNIRMESEILKGKLETSGVSVELSPMEKAIVKYIADANEETILIDSGATEIIKSANLLHLELEGWGKIVVESGAEEVETLKRELHANRSKLHDMLEENAIKTVEEAEKAFIQLQDVSTVLDRQKNEVATLLGEYQTVEEIKKILLDKQGKFDRIKENLQINEDDHAKSVYEMELALEELQATIDDIESTLDLVEKRRTTHKQELVSIAEDRRALQTHKAEIDNEIVLNTQIIHTTKERYPEGIQNAKEKAQSDFVQAEARYAEAQRQLPEDWEKIHTQYELANRAFDQVHTLFNEKNEELAGLREVLKRTESEGSYSKEIGYQEQIDRKRRQRKATYNRAMAARFLANLIEFRKQKTVRKVLTPLENQISAALAELTGNYERKVFLNEDLEIKGVGENPEKMLKYELLSQGTREQLLFALRCAVARELAREEPQILILDDVLVNTDDIRHQRVLNMLISASHSFQCLVLTCHPEKYRGAGTFIKMIKERLN